MKRPKTIEEAQKYIGKLFTCPKYPENPDQGPGFYHHMKFLIGGDILCIGAWEYNLLVKKPDKLNLGSYSLMWEWVELSPPSLPSPDIEDVEDLLNHWE